MLEHRLLKILKTSYNLLIKYEVDHTYLYIVKVLVLFSDKNERVQEHGDHMDGETKE